MLPSNRDITIILTVLQCSHPVLTRDELVQWLDALPTARRPAGELSATQLAELTGLSKTYVRERLAAQGVAPLRFLAHAGHRQALYDRDAALAALPCRKGI